MHDSGFIMDELCSYISCMTFIMIPMLVMLNDDNCDDFATLILCFYVFWVGIMIKVIHDMYEHSSFMIKPLS